MQTIKYSSERKSLLIVWVYYSAAGHFAEVIEIAANYKAENIDIDISIAVNGDTFWRLGKYCPWIKETYPININDVNIYKETANCLKQIPECFDYVIFPKRLFYTPQDFSAELLTCNEFLKSFFKPVVWGGYNDTPDSSNEKIVGRSYSPFKMQLPENLDKNSSTLKKDKILISILLRGASPYPIWPSFRSWKSILKKIKTKYPDAQFILTGITPGSFPKKISYLLWKHRFNKFITSVEGLINCYDVGIDKQLALIQNSDIFISPHTGFAFFAPCLGTPWLSLSGVDWGEHFMAKIPFYASLPKCTRYPCSGEMKTFCKLKLRFKLIPYCMSCSLKERGDDILNGIGLLLNNNYDFHQSYVTYRLNAEKNRVNVQKLYRIKQYFETCKET